MGCARPRGMLAQNLPSRRCDRRVHHGRVSNSCTEITCGVSLSNPQVLESCTDGIIPCEWVRESFSDEPLLPWRPVTKRISPKTLQPTTRADKACGDLSLRSRGPLGTWSTLRWERGKIGGRSCLPCFSITIADITCTPSAKPAGARLPCPAQLVRARTGYAGTAPSVRTVHTTGRINCARVGRITPLISASKDVTLPSTMSFSQGICD
jgi:hypothetical protein